MGERKKKESADFSFRSSRKRSSFSSSSIRTVGEQNVVGGLIASWRREEREGRAREEERKETRNIGSTIDCFFSRRRRASLC